MEGHVSFTDQHGGSTGATNFRTIFEQLPKIVVAHSTFQFGLSGEPSEGALSFPIQSFLRIHTSFVWDIDTEVEHPALKRAGQRGRPAQIDFVGRNRATTNWAFALESKIHDNKRDRLIRDLIKLLLLADHPGSRDAIALFLLLSPLSLKFAELEKSPAGECVHLRQSIYWKPPNENKEITANLFEVLLPWNGSQTSKEN